MDVEFGSRMNSETIRPKELVANLEILRGKIARKPVDYIPQNDYPCSIDDSFSRYTRTRHVNFILSLSDVLRLEFGWPFPFFVLSLSQSKYWLLTAALPIMAWVYVRISLKSMLHWSTDEVKKAWFANIVDKSIVKLVQLSSRKLFRQWRSTKMLDAHHQELKEIQEIYVKGYCYSCVSAVFPLLDYVCRELLQTENLTKGVGHINKIFSQANICLESLRPGHGAWDYAEKNGANAQESSNKDLRLVGIALDSFLQFAAIYYRHFTQGQDTSVLNRHAVLHGARGKIWTKEDATKLLLFLDLMINLLPVFEILLAPVPPQAGQRND